MREKGESRQETADSYWERREKGNRRQEKWDADLRRREKGKGESEKDGGGRYETREGGCRLET